MVLLSQTTVLERGKRLSKFILIHELILIAEMDDLPNSQLLMGLVHIQLSRIAVLRHFVFSDSFPLQSWCAGHQLLGRLS